MMKLEEFVERKEEVMKEKKEMNEILKEFEEVIEKDEGRKINVEKIERFELYDRERGELEIIRKGEKRI